MNKIKSYFSFLICGIIAVTVFSSCSKDDDGVEVNKANILGEWVEDYSDYSYFAPEGYSTYTFKDNGKVDIHIYDVFAGEKDITKTFIVGGEFGENVLVLNPEMSDYTGEAYNIVKLTKSEMEWQMVGTTFQKGSVGGEFKHFIRRK